MDNHIKKIDNDIKVRLLENDNTKNNNIKDFEDKK